MRDAILSLALMGSLIDYLVILGGSDLAPGVAGSLLPGVPPAVSNAIAALAPAVVVVLSIVIWNRDGRDRRLAVALFAAAVIGCLASGNGLYVLGAAFFFIGAVLALFVRPRRPGFD